MGLKTNLSEVVSFRDLMKKKAYLALLAVTLLAVISIHVHWTKNENGTLLVIDNKPVDFLGAINNQWNRVTRTCSAVTRLSPQDEKYQIAELLIRNYSPPSSQTAVIAGAWAMESWILVEVEFQDLLPAVVLIQSTNNQTRIVPNAVWSGYTQPWTAAPYIRNYIEQQVPQLPVSLTRCFDAQSQSFN
jgi:hypothetical protein